MAQTLWNKDENDLDQKTRNQIDNVKKVIYNSLIEFHNHDYRKYIENYKKYLGFVYDRLRGLDDWQTNVDYPLVASVVDTMFGNLFDFGYEFWVSEPMLKKRCSEAFDFRGTGRATFKEVAKEALICGKAYVKDYLLKETQKDKFFGKEIVTEIKMPSMYYISIFDVMYDRSKGLDKSPFKIVRTYTTGQAIKDKILPMLLSDTDEKEHANIKKRFDSLLKTYQTSLGTRFSMYSYNPVKSLASITQFMNAGITDMNYNLPWVQDKSGLAAGIVGTEGTINNEQRNNFFLQTDTSTFELVEYAEADMKYYFVNGALAYFGKKTYNLGEIREATYSIIPGTGNANGVADILGGLQDINNMLWNSFLDNVKLNLGPMFKISGNIPIGKNGTLDFRKFRAFKSNGTSDIEKIQLGVNDFAPVNFMQIVESFAQQRSWVSNYVMGGNGTVERVAGGIDMKFNQYKAKLTPITDSIDQMMGNIARSWIMMYLKYFTKEELADLDIMVEDVLTEKGKFESFSVNGMDIRDIIDERNISFTYNSLDKLTKENSRKSIMETLPAMLQYTANQVNMDEIAKVLAGQDFDPQKIIKKQEHALYDQPPAAPGQPGAPEMEEGEGGQSRQQWSYADKYVKGSSPYMPEAPFNPQDKNGAAPEQPGNPQQPSEDELMKQLSNLV